MDIIQQKLFELCDRQYKEFHQKLMPTVNADAVIGVRIPQLRKLAKQIKAQEQTKLFLNTLPHRYYEENNLHAFLVADIKDFDETVAEIERFLPYIDNWATCDSLRPVSFKTNKKKLLVKIKEWLKSPHTYTVRFAIEMLMVHFLDEDFSEEYLNLVACVKSEEYYINMMIAWYFATALAKQYESAVKCLIDNRLCAWVHNKTIQKATESFRITKERKKYLKTLKKH